jgi:uroporphyrinogen decarboxylase
MGNLTSRERVLKTINHESPDRIPIDLGATINSSMVKEVYDELKKHLNLPSSETEFMDLTQRSVKIEDVVHHYFATDIRGVVPGKSAKMKIEWLDENTFIDEWGVKRNKPKDGYYYEQREFPLAGDISKQDILKYNWPDPDDPQITDGLKKEVKEIREKTDSAIILYVPSPIIHKSQYLRGYEDWYIDCALNVELINFLFDALLEVNLATARNILKEVGNEVDIVMTADDLGTQQGLQISPDFFRNSIKPRFKKYLDLIKQYSPKSKIFFHSCGAIEPILTDFIEIGIDIINPVQISARNMEPELLKKKYGDRLTFWGAVDTQDLLPNGTTEDVKREVEHLINVLGEDGGYILGAVHNIQPGIPIANVVAMYKHAKEYSESYYQDKG